MLRQSLIDSSKYSLKCPYSMTPKGICIHNTANDASAENEIAYMKNNANSTSFHIAIDDKEAIQGLPLYRNGWHAGDGSTGEGNRNYIGVEICYSLSGGPKFIAAEQLAAKEVAALLKRYGWTINNVKKHQDFSGKYCPHRTLDQGWQRFLNMIQAELNKLNTKVPVSNSLKVGDLIQITGTNYATGQTIPEWVKKNTYTITQISGDKALISGIISWVKLIDLKLVKSQAQPEKVVERYINLKPIRSTWAVYPKKGPYITANKVGDLAPKTFGGLSYKILGNPQKDVYVIKTGSFGEVGIYVPVDNESSFTSAPIYK